MVHLFSKKEFYFKYIHSEINRAEKNCLYWSRNQSSVLYIYPFIDINKMYCSFFIIPVL